MTQNFTQAAADAGESDLDCVLTPPMRARLADRAATWRTDGGATAPRKLARRARLPGHHRALTLRSVCAVVRAIANEMLFITGHQAQGRNRRFAVSHVRQIAIYVCHVVLQLKMSEIAIAFGVDRTTVGHACARVEDRRDDGGYDALVGAIERVISHVFGHAGAAHA
jgi:hypothetical protein